MPQSLRGGESPGNISTIQLGAWALPGKCPPRASDRATRTFGPTATSMLPCPLSAREQRALHLCAGEFISHFDFYASRDHIIRYPSYHFRPNFDIFLNIVFSGKCNTGIRTEPDMKPSEFIEGALHATSEVTGAMADGNLVQ